VDHEAAGPGRTPLRRAKEILMSLRFARCAAMAAATVAMALTLADPQMSWAQTPAPPSAEPSKPEAKPVEPAPTTPAQSADAFGEDVTLTAKPIVYVKGTGTWDKSFEIITGAFKRLKTYIDKEGLKADGADMTIFTAPDDTGFQYEAAIPIAEAPKNPPRGDIAVGQSPEGPALKFVHRGSYDSLDDTYEAITNYLDEKRLDAKDMYIEQYETDPLSTDQGKLVVNIFVVTK